MDTSGASFLGWFNLPLQIAIGIALSSVMVRILHIIGIA